MQENNRNFELDISEEAVTVSAVAGIGADHTSDPKQKEIGIKKKSNYIKDNTKGQKALRFSEFIKGTI